MDNPHPAQGKKRKFADAWENIDPCIKKVEGDPFSFQCTICMQLYPVHSQPKIRKHLNSKKHNAIKNGKSRHKKSIVHKFQHKWTEDPRFSQWIQVVPGNESEFRCIVCNVTRSCAGGVVNVEKHAENNKNHIALCKERKITTLDEIDVDVVYKNNENFDNEVKAQSLKYVKFGNELGLSYVAMSKILSFFKTINPSTLQHMTASPKKISCMVQNVIGPLAESDLINKLRHTKFSLHVDDSIKNNKSRMTFLVRFVDSDTLDVTTALPKLITLDATKLNANGLFAQFKKYMTDNGIPFSNILSLSCDHASVMIGKFNFFWQLLLKENELIELIECVCHKLALAAKDSCNALASKRNNDNSKDERNADEKNDNSWKKLQLCDVDGYLTLIIGHFDTQKKIEAFQEIAWATQETDKKLLKYAKTRWLVRHDCIKRLRYLTPSLIRYFNLVLCETPVKSRGKLQIFLDFLTNSESQAYLAFLEYVLFQFNQMNIFFQHSGTRVHLLHSQSVQFLKCLARNFLRPALVEVINEEKINFLPNYILPMEEISFGNDCNEILKKLSENAVENNSIIKRIHQNCLKFYVESIHQIKSRFHDFLTKDFYKKMSVFTVEEAVLEKDRDTNFGNVFYFAEKFGGFDLAHLRNEWQFLHTKFGAQEKLDMYPFDHLWKTILSSKDKKGRFIFLELSKLLGYIRSFPHSNAPAERVSSTVTDLLSNESRCSLSENSVSYITAIRLALINHREMGQSTEITDEHLSRMSSKILYETPKRNEKRGQITLYHASDSELSE